jgi:two-component system OmpR family response regulator
VSILLVEDNARLAEPLARGIEEHGFEVYVVHTGRAAIARLSENDCDAVILDLGLPDIDGLELLRTARQTGMQAPVLVLTARDTVHARAAALDRGADDYLIKPFAFIELVARLRALVRRESVPPWAPIVFGDLHLELESPIVHVGERAVALSPREHALLHHLVRCSPGIVSRRRLLADVFEYAFDPGTNLVEVHVANLRRKLEQAGARSRIETVRGAGYTLRDDIAVSPEAD